MIVHDVDSMAWSGKPPFAGLGAEVSKNASVPEILREAKLNWEVLKIPAHVALPEGETTKIKLIPNNFCLVRQTDNLILTPYVGDRYKVVQNDEAFEVFTDFVRKGEMTLETAGSLSEGRIIWGLANINEGFRLVGGDEIKGYLLLSQSHKYGNSMRVNFTPVRVEGGLTYIQGLYGDKAARWTMPHSRAFNDKQIEKIKHALRIAQANFHEFERDSTMLSNQGMSEKNNVRFMMRVFKPDLLMNLERMGEAEGRDLVPDTLVDMAGLDGASRELQKMVQVIGKTPGMNLDSCNGTMWGSVASVMYYFDHLYGRTQSSRLESSWFGINQKKKHKAFRLACFMAQNNGRQPKFKKSEE